MHGPSRDPGCPAQAALKSEDFGKTNAEASGPLLVRARWSTFRPGVGLLDFYDFSLALINLQAPNAKRRPDLPTVLTTKSITMAKVQNSMSFSINFLCSTLSEY